MSWREKRKQVKDKLDKFAEINQTTMTTEQLVTLRTDHEQLRTSLTNYLKEQAQNYELSNKLEKTGTLQTQIRELEEEKDRLQQDVDTALARDKVLRTRNETGNRHTLYLLDRPIHRGMVPYLWSLSVLFVGIGVLLFYWLTPALLLPASEWSSTSGISTVSSSVMGMFSDIFASRYTWMALFGAASIVILFLSLKIAGVFGK
jgi:hypothetical protein